MPPSTSETVKTWQYSKTGVPCFIIGTAPSVLDLTLAEASQVNNEFVIGINAAFLYFNTDIILWLDDEFWEEFHEPLKARDCIKLNQLEEDPENNIFTLHINHKEEGYHIPKDFDDVQANIIRMNSAAIAFQVAVLFGCSPIIMLGFDCGYRDGMTNCYGNNPAHDEETLPNCLAAARFIRDSGFRVINCSDNNEFSKRWTITEAFSKRWTI